MLYVRKWLEKLLAVPQDIPDEDLYRAHILYAILWLYGISISFLLVYAFIAPPWHAQELRINLLILAGWLVPTIYQLRRRHWNAVVYLLIVPLWVVISYSAVITGGIYSSSIILYFCPMLMSVVLLNNRATFVITAATLAFLLTLMILEIGGIVDFPLIRTPLYRFTITTVICAGVVGVLEFNKHKLREFEAKNRKLYLEAQISKIQNYYSGSLSHDLRTPLTVLKNTTYLIKERSKRGLAIDQQLDKVDTYIEKLNQMVNDLIQISELNDPSSAQQDRLQPVEISSVIECALEMCSDYFPEKNITITFQNDLDRTGFVLGEARYLQLMFKHIIKNARQYGRQNGKITIKLSKVDSNLSVEIADDGIGIAPDQLEKVFEPFYRVNEARTSNENSGTGIGLAIAQRVAQLHQGSITVKSQLDIGSTFTIMLPAQNNAT